MKWRVLMDKMGKSNLADEFGDKLEAMVED
jgi:hypothetical protein